GRKAQAQRGIAHAAHSGNGDTRAGYRQGGDVTSRCGCVRPSRTLVVVAFVHELRETRPVELDRRFSIAPEPGERSASDDHRADLLFIGVDVEVDRCTGFRQLMDLDAGANRMLSSRTL